MQARLRLIGLIGLRQLAARPGRTALAVGGIAVGTAMLLAIQLINVASLAALRRTVDDTAGRASLQVVPPTEVGFPEEVLETVRATPGVSVAVPVVEGAVLVEDGRGESLVVLGVDLGNEESVRDYDGVGRDAEEVIADPLVFLAQPDSVVVTRPFAAARGLGADAKLTVVGPAGRRTLTVRGLLAPDGVARAMGGGFAVMDVFAAARLFGREGRFDRVDVVVAPAADVETVAAALRARVPPGLEVERPARRGERVEGMLAAFQTMLSSLSWTALLVAAFIVYNSLATVVVERRAEVGILRALGARRRDVLALFLAEALCAGLLGVTLGSAGGLVLAHALVGWVATSASTALFLPAFTVEPALDPRAVALAIAAGLGTILAAALLPARAAARLPPVEAVRAEPPPLHERTLRGPLAAALAAVVLAVAALVVARVTGRPAWAYLANVASLAAVALVSVPAVLGATRVVPWTAGRIFGVSGRLAGDGALRMPGRAAITVAALALGLSLSAGLSTLSRSFEDSVRAWIRTWTEHDLGVMSAVLERGFLTAPLPLALADELRAVPGVRAVTTFRMIRQRWAGDRITVATGVAGSGKRVGISETFARRFAKRPGDLVRLDTPSGRRTFRVAYVKRDYNSERGTVEVPERTFRRVWRDRMASELDVQLSPGASATAVRAAILRRLGATHRLQVMTPKEAEEHILHGVADAFAFTWALELLTLLVGGLGVADTVLAGVIARRREIGVLRAIGCRRRDVAATFALEGVVLGAVGALLGTLGGIAVAGIWTGFVFPELIGYGTDFHVPAGGLGLVFLSALALTAAAAAVPARRAARLPIREALAGI
jgi:putative ABC transport system permease protein